jgi:hypothetical protein
MQVLVLPQHKGWPDVVEWNLLQHLVVKPFGVNHQYLQQQGAAEAAAAAAAAVAAKGLVNVFTWTIGCCQQKAGCCAEYVPGSVL